MTVKDKFIKMLMDMGMFEAQADEVMFIADIRLKDVLEGYSITWNSPSDEYPQPIYNVLMMSIKPIALEWIEENAPQAWFKTMFE